MRFANLRRTANFAPFAGTACSPHGVHRLAGLVETQRETFALLIAREGGKPYSDALVETDRATDGIRNAADLLRMRGGVEIPMGLTPASADRWAFTTREPIGVVAAISAFSAASGLSSRPLLSLPTHNTICTVPIHLHGREAKKKRPSSASCAPCD